MGYRISYIDTRLINNNITRYIAILLFCLIPLKGVCQTGEETVNVLVGMGFENVGWHETDEERVYVMENTAYRLNGVGISKAVDVVQRMGLPEKKPCRLIILDNNIPQISLYYQPTTGESTLEAARSDWKVSYDLGGNWRKAVREKKKNSSLYKVDITIYPELSLKNLVITQIYQVLFNLSPAIEVSLWKGMKLTAQMVFPVYNDGYGTRYGKIHPGFLALQQTVRLPYNTWGTLAVGTFSSDRYGVDLQMKHVLMADERFSIEGGIGLTNPYYWYGFDYIYNTKSRLTWNLGVGFYWPQFNVQTILKAEQYLWGEKGLRLDVMRHFRYATIGFYAMKAKGAKSNGGFRFQIALPPYKYKRRGYIPRIIPSKNMGLAYNAGNEQRYYRNYRVGPGNNIMQANSFNPYYVKSEMLNY